MQVSFTWLGHSTFIINFDGRKLIIDPFLTNNPFTEVTPSDVDVELIVLTHAHGDHLGFTDAGPAADTIDIAKNTGAQIICNFEMGNWFMGQGLENVAQGNPGGTIKTEFVDVKFTKAFHSSSFGDGTYGGQPNGMVMFGAGKRLYHAGDTSLFGDMALIGESGLDVAFLPIGDVFTMGIEDSIKATKLLKPHYVVPMHFNTFPPITQDAAQWAEMVNRATDAQPVVLDPGSEHSL